ncbi:DNA binding domain, excisionase family, partial [Dysosmobacter welbionis]
MLIGLLRREPHVPLDLRPGGQIQLPQAPGVALGLLHPLVRRQVVIEGPQLGTVHLHRVPAPPPAGECLQ